MDILELIIRIILLITALYVILEFIVICDVSTGVGAAILLASIGGTLAFFFFAKRYQSKRCNSCGGKGVVNPNS